MRTATCTREEESRCCRCADKGVDGTLSLLSLIVVSVTCGVLGVVPDVEDSKEADALLTRDALVGVMRCGDDLGVLERDDCPSMANLIGKHFLIEVDGVNWEQNPRHKKALWFAITVVRNEALIALGGSVFAVVSPILVNYSVPSSVGFRPRLSYRVSQRMTESWMAKNVV